MIKTTKKAPGWYLTNLVVVYEGNSNPVEITTSMDKKRDSWKVTGVKGDFISKQDALSFLNQTLSNGGIYDGLQFVISSPIKAQELHRQAMNLVENVRHNINPEIRKNQKLLKEAAAAAFLLEKQAAELTPFGIEPTRGVLFRSAGWLAVSAEQHDEALKMAEEGLKGAKDEMTIKELNGLKDFIIAYKNLAK
jgi:hypothetical protein